MNNNTSNFIHLLTLDEGHQKYIRHVESEGLSRLAGGVSGGQWRWAVIQGIVRDSQSVLSDVTSPTTSTTPWPLR